MKGRWLLALIVGGFCLALYLMLTFAQSYRPIREKFVVGLWSNKGFESAHQPILLHIFADHSYTVESANDHIREKGSWKISGFPDRGFLILDGYHLGTDTHADGKLTLDITGRTLADPYGSTFMAHQYIKKSDEPEAKLTPPETFVLGKWTNNLKWDDKDHRIYVFSSDHSFSIGFDGDGKWRVEGSKIRLDWIDEEDEKPRSLVVMMNRDKGTMAEPNGRTLTRINRSY